MPAGLGCTSRGTEPGVVRLWQHQPTRRKFLVGKGGTEPACLHRARHRRSRKPCFHCASQAQHKATLSASLQTPHRHVYFIGVRFQLAGDHPLQCQRCVNLLLRKCALPGLVAV